MQLRLEAEGELLRFYRLDTGAKLLIPTELAELAEQERLRAEQERLRAEQENQRAEQERLRADRLEEYLRSQGIDPNNLPQ